jgi:hypothetical protein
LAREKLQNLACYSYLNKKVPSKHIQMAMQSEAKREMLLKSKRMAVLLFSSITGYKLQLMLARENSSLYSYLVLFFFFKFNTFCATASHSIFFADQCPLRLVAHINNAPV